MSDPLILAENVICDAALSRRMRQKLNTLFARYAEPEDHVDALLLALTEHLANLFQHTDGQQCSVYWYPKIRELSIIDNGKSIESLLQNSDELEQLEMQESGMGLSLITSLFPNYKYSADDQQGNQLTLQLPDIVPKVVVIDDDPVFLSLMSAYLDGEYQVFEFSDAQTALNSEAMATTDIVVCDLHMPSMSGYALREQLLENETTALLPFIFLTGDDSQNQRLHASESQVDDYIIKPIDKSLLLATLRRVLLRSKRVKRQINDQMDDSINRSLWPTGPWQCADTQISCAYQVAERGGGDFLFHQGINNGHRFVLGDVMGHGEQAKFYAFALTGLLSGLCSSMTAEQPVNIFLNKLSALMFHSELLNNTIVTLQVIDVMDNGSIQLASAGHPHPWKISQHGQLSTVEITGVLPGLDEESSYSLTDIHLTEGESLMLYTDGLVEAVFQQTDEAAVEPELASAIAKVSSKPSASALSEFWSFDDRMLDDDVSLLVINQSG